MAQGGITVTEAVGADQPIVRLPTATTGFIGRALRGPVNRPVRGFPLSVWVLQPPLYAAFP